MPKVRSELSEVCGEQVCFSTMSYLFYHPSQLTENVLSLWYLPGMGEWISGKAHVWANVCVLEAGPDLQSGPWTWTWPGSHRELLPQSPAALPHHACPSQDIPGTGFRSWSSSPCLRNFLSLGKMVSADEVCYGLQTLIRNITVLFWRHLSSFFWKQEANLESV